MRKLLTAAALAALALGGAAACATAPPDDASSASADQTADVCTQAIATEQQNSAAALAKVNQATAEIAAGNTANVAQYQADLEKILSDWTAKYNELAAKPIKPEVKAAIGEWQTFLGQIASEADTTTTEQVQATFTELNSKLVTACG